MKKKLIIIYAVLLAFGWVGTGLSQNKLSSDQDMQWMHGHPVSFLADTIIDFLIPDEQASGYDQVYYFLRHITKNQVQFLNSLESAIKNEMRLPLDDWGWRQFIGLPEWIRKKIGMYIFVGSEAQENDR